MSDEEEALNKLQQLNAEPKTIEVFDTEFDIHPFDNKEFFNVVVNAERRGMDDEDIITTLVTKILQKDDEDISEEDVENAPPGVTMAVIDAMEEVNGLEDFFSKAKSQMQEKQR